VSPARALFALTSAVVSAGLVLQLALAVTADPEEGLFVSTPDRVVNFFSFFTVLSNVGVAVTTGLLAADPGRRSTVFRVARLTALIAIVVTGVVFHTTLAQLQELTGWGAFADAILHTASPVLCAGGWLLFGPRGHVTRRVVLLSVVGPVVWIVYTLVRGELVDDRYGSPYYPYPFMDVADHGYGVVLANVTIVAVLFLALAAGALWLDRRLPGGSALPA
jgi:hypothetical protein